MSDTLDISNSIKVGTGGYFDLLAPRPHMVKLLDIANALSKICRFGGHLNQWYSVAEHSILCADVVREMGGDLWDQRAALMHDAAEAYIGDMVRPLKAHMDDYKQREADIETVISVKFNLGVFRRELVSQADTNLLHAERLFLFGDDGVQWAGQSYAASLPGIKFRCLDHNEARYEFLQKASALGVFCE